MCGIQNSQEIEKKILCTLFFFAVNDFIVGADAFDDVTAMTRHMENIVPSIVSDDDSK